MTLEELLCRFTGEADINVLDPDTTNAVMYIPGEGALIPKKVRERKVLRFSVGVEYIDESQPIPLLVVYLKGANAA